MPLDVSAAGESELAALRLGQTAELVDRRDAAPQRLFEASADRGGVCIDTVDKFVRRALNEIDSLSGTGLGSRESFVVLGRTVGSDDCGDIEVECDIAELRLANLPERPAEQH